MCEEKQESAQTKQPRTYEEIKAARVDSDAISATGENRFNFGFSPWNLTDHWGGSSDHSQEYAEYQRCENCRCADYKCRNCSSCKNCQRAELYKTVAEKLVQSATNDTILGYKRPLSGQVVRYDKTTNNYAVGHPDEGVATMFKPPEGEEYFHRTKKWDLRRKKK